MSYKTISNRDNVQSELLTPREIHAQSNERIPSTKLTKYKNKVFVKHYAPVVTRSVKKLFQHSAMVMIKVMKLVGYIEDLRRFNGISAISRLGSRR